MLQIYREYHLDIERATVGTQIDPGYMAAIISLESHPPGNRRSERFEAWVYERLIDLKLNGRAFGTIPRNRIDTMSDSELKRMATSYGLTQIMGYHCLDLGCSVDDLRGEYHLQWAVVYMMRHYGDRAKNKDWTACFRIHNTGHPRGTTGRKDYVERGLARMFYYSRWRERRGQFQLPEKEGESASQSQALKPL